MGRLRTILIILIVLIAIVAAVVFLLPNLTGGGQVATTPDADGTPAPIVNVAQTLPTPTPLQLTEIVIAVQELPRGIPIPPNAVALRPWPLESAPINGITNLEDVVGKIARTDIFREEPILSNMVVDDLTSLARVGSDAAAILPSGLVAISVPMDRLTSVAYGIQDGDRVDVIMSMLFVDVDEEFQTILPNRVTLVSQDPETQEIQLTTAIEGRLDPLGFGNAVVGPSERQRPRLVTQRTIQDALVVHVGEFPPDGRFIGVPSTPTPAPDGEGQGDAAAQGNATAMPTPTFARPNIVTLGVTPQDAVVLTYTIEARLPLTFVLRSARDTSRVATDPVTLDYIMTEFNIQLPGRRPYSIEPAIRSIRQLLVEDQLQLGTDATGGGG
ncbi:MAG: Flp pilus assembly protein CpaB [Anaerolineae bacterium]|nr:Flp pilus assembly protein CpaB [Anaerolineae bacterium]